MKARAKISVVWKPTSVGHRNPSHPFSPGHPLSTSRLRTPLPRRFLPRSTTTTLLPHAPSMLDSPRRCCTAPPRHPGDASRLLLVRSTSSPSSSVLSSPPPRHRLPIRSTSPPPSSSLSSPPPRHHPLPPRHHLGQRPSSTVLIDLWWVPPPSPPLSWLDWSWCISSTSGTNCSYDLDFLVAHHTV
jgi:hypothetical protein